MAKAQFSVVEGGLLIAEKYAQLEQQFKANLSRACAYGDLVLLEETLNKPAFQPFIPAAVYDNTGPCMAARNGHLRAVAVAIQHHSFEQFCPQGQIQYYINEVFLYATLGEHLSVMRYLLDDPTLKVRAQLDALDKRAFFLACRGNRLCAIEFFIKERQLYLSPLDRLELFNNETISNEVKSVITKLDSGVFGIKSKAHLTLVT